MTITSSLLCCSLFAPVPDLFVVDETGGPGAQFRDIHEAVSVARSGDMILVEKGATAPWMSMARAS